MIKNVRQQFQDMESSRYPLFAHDPERKAALDEVEIDDSWQIRVSGSEKELGKAGAQELSRFLKEVMGLMVAVVIEENSSGPKKKCIRILSSGGGIENSLESFTLEIEKDGVVIKGATPQGALQGILYLEDLMGVEEAPVLRRQETVRWPRLPFRFGTVRRPSANYDVLQALHKWYKNDASLILSDEDEMSEILRLGYNSCWLASEEIWDLADGDILKEIQTGKASFHLPRIKERADAAKRFGLKTCVMLRVWKTWPENHPLFQKYPDIKGARKHDSHSIYSDSKYDSNRHHTLCTESEIVKQFISESVTNLFVKTGLDVLVVLVGGESFHHCFMRPVDCKKGHTDCPRCETLGAETVVANLVNLLSEAARKANPEAQVLAWPYSASWAWSKEDNQESWIRLLKPGAVLLTEVEKDEKIEKGSYIKHLWDYSIDLVEPGPKCRSQIAVCKEIGLPVYLMTVPSLTIEFMHVSHLPCINRWVDRAVAIAQSGADGVFAMQAFYGRPPSIAQYIAKWFWWEPNPNRDVILDKIARMVAGATAANHVRRAWSLFSEAMGYMPILATGYISSPTYLGPAHPLLLDPEEKLPQEFYSIECTLDIEVEPYRPSVPAFVKDWKFTGPQMRDWHKMEKLSRIALEDLDKASPLVPAYKNISFLNEYLTLKHLTLTVRTCVDIAEFCQARDALVEITTSKELSARKDEAQMLYDRMKFIAINQLACAQDDEPVVASHPWLDYRHQGDGTHFHHTIEILRTKIEHTKQLISVRLPEYAKCLGLSPYNGRCR